VTENLIDQIHTRIMKVSNAEWSSYRTLANYFSGTCTSATLLWAYSYAGPSNFGRFDQIFWRIIWLLTEALVLQVSKSLQITIGA